MRGHGTNHQCLDWHRHLSLDILLELGTDLGGGGGERGEGGEERDVLRCMYSTGYR